MTVNVNEVDWRASRFFEAYLAMANLGYRPQAPSDDGDEWALRLIDLARNDDGRVGVLHRALGLLS